MALIADIFLVAAALGATFYCFVLSRRLSRFTDLEKGVGGAIAVLSSQVDDMTRTLKSAQGAASASASSLGALTGRAEDAARRLELLVASMHDLPPLPGNAPATAQAQPPAPDPRPAAAPAPEPSQAKPAPAAAPEPAPEPESTEAAPAPDVEPGAEAKFEATMPVAAFSSRRSVAEAAE